ncbi:response regulator [Deinococcus misasensis]|uniref:response regulator n=1 Tax=Deinococcus misasensis TaxID=392413 RepID=UPI0005520C44|nr:response regulator [Deinococcus misasensis]
MPYKVVVVEDDPLVARINRDTIEKHPAFQVIGHADGYQSGLHIIQALKPELIVLDTYLPDGNGLELLKTIRQQNISTDVIMLTAASDLMGVQQALRDGILDYLIKPVQEKRLLQTLERFVERNKPMHSQLTQARLDQMLGVRQDGHLPKGIQAQTLQDIKILLEDVPAGLTVDEVSEQLSINRVTAWRYLEYLLELGDLGVNLQYGNVGRPSKRYRLRK